MSSASPLPAHSLSPSTATATTTVTATPTPTPTPTTPPGPRLAPARPVSRRLGLVLALLASLAPAAARRLAPVPGSRAPCEPDGRGTPPRGWVGCATDSGPRRALSDEERLAFGLPLDPNTADASALASVPGLGPALARAVVADRNAHGPYASVDDLRRVKGIGPKRIERARAALALSTPVAPAADAR